MSRRWELDGPRSIRNAGTTPYSSEPVDLRCISWDFKTERSTAGAAPKAKWGGKYYKLSSYNCDAGFYGDEAITECVVSDILDTLGVDHIKYSLVMGDIVYRGIEYTTPVCISDDFNPQSRPVVSIERYLEACCPRMKPLEACLQLGWANYVYTTFLVDFLIANRDRHGANLEVMEGTPIPLFDHGAALTVLQDYKVWNHWSCDRVNNYIGSYSLKENLYRIPLDSWPAVSEPDVKVVSRYSNFWFEDKIAFVQRMLTERWAYIEQRRVGII